MFKKQKNNLRQSSDVDPIVGSKSSLAGNYRLSNATLRSILGLLPEFCFYISKDFRVCFLNKDISPFWARRLDGLFLKDLLSSQVYSEVIEILQKCKETKTISDYGLIYKKFGYAFALKARLAYSPESRHDGFLVILRNETQLFRNSELLASSKTKLFDSAKMARLGEMAGNIAHEINNPLTVIIGLAELNLSDLQDIKVLKKREFSKKVIDLLPELTARLEKIVLTSNRIAKIVFGLKRFARDSRQEVAECVSMAEILEETLAICQSGLLAKGIKVLVDSCPSEFTSVRGKKIQMSQILMNLFANSADAIANLKEKWIHVSFEITHGGKLLLRVCDSGSGIPENVANKIFEPFFTSKEAGKGTGIGLSISKDMANSFGADLFLDSSKTNTCFCIALQPFEQSLRQAA